MTLNFMRKWRVLVADGNNVALDVSDLRITFTIQRLGYQAINFGDITIYNLNSGTEADIVRSGMRVIVEAGYQEGAYGKIFDGVLFQPIWDRENVVDNRLTLHCFDGDEILTNNFVIGAAGASHGMRDDMLYIMANARQSMQGDVGDALDSAPMPRGKVFFGNPKKYLREAANANNAQWFVNDGSLNFVSFAKVPQTQAIEVTPQNGLIGVPQQVENGVEFRTLLNPLYRIANPPMQVKIDQSVIRAQRQTPGQTLPTRLSQDGFYYVASITHQGDTRGDEWFTDVRGFCANASGLASMFLDNSRNLN